MRMGMIAPGLTVEPDSESQHGDKAVQPHASMKEIVDLYIS